MQHTQDSHIDTTRDVAHTQIRKLPYCQCTQLSTPPGFTTYSSIVCYGCLCCEQFCCTCTHEVTTNNVTITHTVHSVSSLITIQGDFSIVVMRSVIGTGVLVARQTTVTLITLYVLVYCSSKSKQSCEFKVFTLLITTFKKSSW